MVDENGKTKVMGTMVESVLARPFTELMALVMAGTMIAYGYYHLTFAQPELVRQIQAGYERNDAAHMRELQLLMGVKQLNATAVDNHE